MPLLKRSFISHLLHTTLPWTELRASDLTGQDWGPKSPPPGDKDSDVKSRLRPQAKVCQGWSTPLGAETAEDWEGFPLYPTAYIFNSEDGPVLLSGCWLNTIFKFCFSASWKSWPEKIRCHETIWKNSSLNKQWEARLPNGRLGIQCRWAADLPMCFQHCQRYWKVLFQSHMIRGHSLIFFWNAGKTVSEYFKNINIILEILPEE